MSAAAIAIQPPTRTTLRLLTPKDVARDLNMSQQWVRENAVALGGFKLGDSWRFHPEDIDKYIARKRSGTV